jgi:glycosyltransferase involved in cell wall biosynthesis
MTSAKLALCIPAYNAANFLPRLLNSAQAQTHPFDEIWVYDDYSTDHTAAIAQKMGAQVVRGDENRGCSHGKNVLAEKTTCEWIHFHDADDELYPNFVKYAQHWMQLDPAPDIVLFSYEQRVENTGEMIGIRQFDDAEMRQDAIAYALREQINPFCGLYKRSAYLQAGGYDTDPLVLYNEDVAFHLRMAIAGLKFAADPTVTVINYHRTNSMSSANRIKCARAHFNLMKKAADALQGHYRQEIARNLWGIAAISAAYLDWEYVDNAVRLALSWNSPVPREFSSLFRLCCRFNPYLAYRLREWGIRVFKAKLRQERTV